MASNQISSFISFDKFPSWIGFKCHWVEEETPDWTILINTEKRHSESFKNDPVVHINRNCHFVAGDQRTQVFILGTDVSDQTGDSWSIIHVLEKARRGLDMRSVRMSCFYQTCQYKSTERWGKWGSSLSQADDDEMMMRVCVCVFLRCVDCWFFCSCSYPEMSRDHSDQILVTSVMIFSLSLTINNVFLFMSFWFI